MTVDVELVLTRLARAGKGGVIPGLIALSGYGGVFLSNFTFRDQGVRSTELLWQDPILNGIIAFMGASTILSSASLAFLARLYSEHEEAALIVTLLAGLGAGFGAATVRFTLPVVIKHV